MSEVLLPPWIQPQAETTTLIDDSTSVFRAAYAPGNAQRVGYTDPRLQVKQSFKGLRGFERAAMLAALSRAKGKLNTVRALVGYALRGSFPATEMFANNDFSNGTSGWSADAQYALSAIDRGVRVTRSQVTAASFALTQSIAQTVGIPYAIRVFLNAGKGSVPVFAARNPSILFGPVSQGMNEGAYTVAATGSDLTGFFDPAASGYLAGNYFDAKWASLSRCAQVDNGVNLLLNSDTPGTGTGWTLNMATAATAGATGPDGTADGWKLTETATTGNHYALQAVTIPAAAADFSYGIFVSQGGSPRGFCWIQLIETLGPSGTIAFLNLATGAITNVTPGANTPVISTTAVNYGNGWWLFTLTVRKTNAATTLQIVTGTATAAGTQSFAGSTGAFLLVWRASLAASSVAVAPVGTTSAAQLGTNQTGNNLNVKGLPLSTAGLLLEGDPFAINGELKICLSALNSDAAGLGYLSFAPSLCRSPSDGDGVVINKPMGRFILAADASWVNDFGVYADIDITLEAINE